MTMNLRNVLTAAVLFSASWNGFAVTNYWVNNGGFSGTFNDGSASSHWDASPGGAGGGAAPGASTEVAFDNGQTTPYTVTFSGGITTSVFNVQSDNVVFDLAGYTWITRLAGFGNPPFNYSDGSRIGNGTSTTGTATVASSAAGGVLRDFLSAGDFPYYALGVGYYPGTGSKGTLNINDSLGFGAKVWHRGNLFVGYGYGGDTGEMTVSGSGSEYFSDYYGEITINGGGTLNVINGAKFTGTHNQYFKTAQSPEIAYVNVASGGILQHTFGWYSVYNPSVLSVSSGGTWLATDVIMGGYRFYHATNMYVNLTIDGAGSSYRANNVSLGYGSAGIDGNAQINVQNGGALSVTNTLLVRELTPGGVTAGIITNRITLNNGSIILGGSTSTNNGLLEVHGHLRGVGTISAGTGNPGNFLVSIGDKGQLRAGDISDTPAIGTLSVTDGDLVVGTGGASFFDLAASGAGDLVDITGGSATIGGTLNVNFLGYTPMMNDRWELVTADTVTYSGVNNITAALTPFGLGSHYMLFIEDNGGSQSLVLLIPEPTSLTLLALGGLAFLRRRRAS